ncbi:MAG TPA: restriction endonuclease [Propionibacteriaceae bacterium]|nr:restriction endonuclease [Propionibacteriaceae bacterium]
MAQARLLGVGDVLRYSRDFSPLEALVGDYINFWAIQNAPEFAHSRLMLERGINGVAQVSGPDGPRTPLIALRSSPWKSGQDTTPWHDEFDLDHGHIRYFGDHKVSTLGPVGITAGNKQLLHAWSRHGSGDREDRILAPPLLMFRATPVVVDGRRIDKGHVEFCGVTVIERLEFILQRDPRTRRTFPNLALDLDVLRLDENDEFDWRWLDDRRDPSLSAEETLRHAPDTWKQWVNQGKVVLSRVRRRVLSSRVLSRGDQLPLPGSLEAAILEDVYHAFDHNKHAFEWLAAKVAEHVLTAGGARYQQGWLTRAGGDGGMDFVGRLDVGNTSSQAPLVVLGQAKCVDPGSIISPDQVARVVARLRRGWIGVFVTTGSFSQQAQVEIVDDEYPIVLIPGRSLAEAVRQLAEQGHRGDVSALLNTALADYSGAITNRRPSEILTAG